jgi:hypothetical protein
MLGSFKTIRLLNLKRIHHRFTLGYIRVIDPGYHQRHPRPTHQQLPVTSWFFPTVSCAKGALLIQPSTLSQVHSMPFTSA